MTNSQNKRRGRRILWAVLASVSAAAVLAAGLYGWLYIRGREQLFDKGSAISAPDEVVQEDENTVVYNGVTYRYNDAVTATLVMGVDKQDIQVQEGVGGNGQADCLFLAVMDTRNGTTHMLPISRETMVDVDRYAQDGTYLGSQKTQLCLAYAHGETAQASCENVVRSVSRLLYGMPINSYLAIDMAGFKALTKAVGGVTLTALEDIPAYEGFVVRKGQTITLNGDQAQAYIQNRGQDVEANNRRMVRQKQFVEAFIGTAGKQLKKDFTKLTSYYTAAKPYVVSNLTLSQITYLATQALAGNAWQSIAYASITGETVMGEEHVEFYADSTAVYEAVLKAFYIPDET
ncbi:MAG: LCP family protein [Clostridia bacterium]|nr:LCP family protein [Clostridia bacterium]